MRKIIYMYSSLARQLFIISLGLLFTARLILFVEGAVFKIDKFNVYNLPATITLMIVSIFFCAFLFVGQRFFYGEFTGTELFFHNLLTRKTKHVYLDKVVLAEFMTTGVKLYYNISAKPVFKIPFYRLGIVSPIGISSFEKLMEYKNVKTTKTYTVLPCYSRGFKFISFAYIALLIGFLLNTFKVVILDVLIFQQYM